LLFYRIVARDDPELLITFAEDDLLSPVCFLWDASGFRKLSLTDSSEKTA